jgi:hypothetical protein
MPLETATYISDLNSTNPTVLDDAKEGDDHLRLLKSTIKTTFPNVTGAVLPTHTELNFVDGVTSSIQNQIDSLSAGVTALTSNPDTIANALVGDASSMVTINSSIFSLLGEVTLASGANVSFTSTNITKSYRQLIIHYHGLSHNSGTTQTFEIQLSGDSGATYTSGMVFTNAVAASASVGGQITITKSASGVYMLLSSTVDITTGHALTSGLVLPSGTYVNHIRIRPLLPSIDFGNIRLWGLA